MPMKIPRLISLSLLFCFVLSSCSTGKNLYSDPIPAPPNTSLETDTLKAKPGYKGKILGASVEESKMGPAGEVQIIQINLPVDPNQVDEVQVISPTGETVKQRRAAEIMRNYESDNVGVTIFLSKDKNWEFKLKLIDNTRED